eukprot:scaffold65602_cov33-Attheya_sp.AAC.1
MGWLMEETLESITDTIVNEIDKSLSSTRGFPTSFTQILMRRYSDSLVVMDDLSCYLAASQ